MRPMIIVTIILVSALAPASLRAQAATAATFLAVAPSAEASGMGETAVAVPSDDPAAFLANPALAGLQGGRTHLSVSRTGGDWLPGLHLPDAWYRTFAAGAGVEFRGRLGAGFGLAAGLSYAHIRRNLGWFTITGPDGPEPLGTFEVGEDADAVGAGLALSSWVTVAAGVTLKHVTTGLAIDARGNPSSASAATFDYGFFLQLPVTGTISRLTGSPLRILPSLSPEFDLTFGAARQNLGDAALNGGAAGPGEPLPRTARLGLSVGGGIAWTRQEVVLRPVALRWSIESSEVLVRRSAQQVDSAGNVVGPPWTYTGGYGSIRVVDELILGHGNARTQRHKGWQVEFFETVLLRGGRSDHGPSLGGQWVGTTGFGLRLAGILKVIRSEGAPLAEGGVLGFFVDHVDLRYDHARYETDDAESPLNGTTFDALRLSVAM